MPSNVKLLAGASGGEPTDANFKNVTLLLHGDGSNGAQNNTFIDSSTNNFTITRNGNTTQGSFSPYGSNWSNYFDGNGDYLTGSSSIIASSSTSTFTIEGWVFPTTFANRIDVIGDMAGAGTNDTKVIAAEVNTSGQVALYWFDGAIKRCTGNTAMVLNQWNYFAIVVSSNAISIYVNKTTADTLSGTTTLTNRTQTFNFAIGAYYNAPTFNGYFSNLRVSTIARTISSVPTAPLTADANTRVLTCAYNRFRDGSTNNFTITRNGDVKVTNFAPFAPSSAYSTSANGGSAYFDGTSDWLVTGSNSAFAMGTGDFTWEAWIYFASASSYRQIFSTRDVSGLGGSLAVNPSNGLTWYTNGFIIDYTTSIGVNQWVHVAVSRSGTSLRVFANGVQVGSATNSQDMNSSKFAVGANVPGDETFTGYISNVRVVKGAAVYTTAFTPPSSPVTAITNTSLLLNATNAAIFDNSMKNDLETVGNAQISTSVKKFGTGSMYFDGSGDYLITPLTPALNLSSGNWTIEGWFYPNNSSTNMVFAMVGNNGSDKIVLATLSPNGYIAYLLNASVVISTTSAVTNNAWSHFALVKNGSTTTLYLNGTSVGTTTSVPTSSDKLFGAGRDVISGGAEVNGYVDEIRITNGVARYTANFTPPTAPFPNK